MTIDRISSKEVINSNKEFILALLDQGKSRLDGRPFFSKRKIQYKISDKSEKLLSNISTTNAAEQPYLVDTTLSVKLSWGKTLINTIISAQIADEDSSIVKEGNKLNEGIIQLFIRKSIIAGLGEATNSNNNYNSNVSNIQHNSSSNSTSALNEIPNLERYLTKIIKENRVIETEGLCLIPGKQVKFQ